MRTDGQMDRRADITKLIDSLNDYVNAPKTGQANYKYHFLSNTVTCV